MFMAFMRQRLFQPNVGPFSLAQKMADRCTVMLAVPRHFGSLAGKTLTCHTGYDVDDVLYQHTRKKSMPLSCRNLRIFSFSAILIVIRAIHALLFDEDNALFHSVAGCLVFVAFEHAS